MYIREHPRAGIAAVAAMCNDHSSGGDGGCHGGGHGSDGGNSEMHVDWRRRDVVHGWKEGRGKVSRRPIKAGPPEGDGLREAW